LDKERTREKLEAAWTNRRNELIRIDNENTLKITRLKAAKFIDDY